MVKGCAGALKVCCLLIVLLLLSLSACREQIHVTLDPAGGELARTEYSFSVGTPSALPIPEREGYLFAGWDRDPETLTEDAVLSASWEPIYQTVRFDPSGGETTTPELLNQTVAYGGSAVCPAVTRENYRFSGWGDGWQCVTGDVTLRAQWGLEPLTSEALYGKCVTACVELQTYDVSDINVSLGSGFLISADGEVATAAHVLKGARRVEVRLDDGRRYFAAEVLACDFELDIAIIKIEEENLPFLELSHDELDNNQTVYSIGSPSGRTGELSKGRLLRYSMLYNHTGCLTTTLPLEGGSSGSPLLDARGRVIGVNMAISNLYDEALAIPVAQLRKIPRRAESIEAYAARCAAYAFQTFEREPDFLPELSQQIEPSQFVRATLTSGDIDCYSCVGTLNMMFAISIDRKYIDMIDIECSADGAVPRVVLNQYYGTSGQTVIFLRTLISDEGVTARLRVSARDGVAGRIPYSVRAVVFDAASEQDVLS